MSIYLFAGVIIDFATFTLMCLLKYTRTRAQVLWTISPKYRNIGRKKVMLCQRSSEAHIKNPFEMRCKHQIDYMQQYIACIIEKSAVCFLCDILYINTVTPAILPLAMKYTEIVSHFILTLTCTCRLFFLFVIEIQDDCYF